MTSSSGFAARGYKVAPTSIKNIRSTANKLMRIFGTEGISKPDVGLVMENLHLHGITLIVLDDDDTSFSNGIYEAYSRPELAEIYLPNATYLKACNSDPRAVFTLYHELGHIIFQHNMVLHRTNTTEIKPYEDSEWQADQFSAEMCMPYEIIQEKKLNSAEAIKSEFGVSDAAAQRRYSQIEKQMQKKQKD
jgi:hypothetical protein